MNLKSKFYKCVMHPIMIVYTLSVYIRFTQILYIFVLFYVLNFINLPYLSFFIYFVQCQVSLHPNSFLKSKITHVLWEDFFNRRTYTHSFNKHLLMFYNWTGGWILGPPVQSTVKLGWLLNIELNWGKSWTKLGLSMVINPRLCQLLIWLD